MAGASSSKIKPQQKNASKTLPKGPSKLVKAYLILYNTVQTTGWSYLLYQLVTYYIPGFNTSNKSLWDTVYWSVMIFQNAAVMEVVHAVVGFVPSNIAVTLMQVYSRIFIVGGVLLATDAAPAGMGLPLSLLAWSITEIVRYGYYTMNLLNAVPKFLIFLRYTLFLALYPIGITGELLCMYHAQQEIGALKKWTVSMPNTYNFIFNYQHFMIFYMLLYIPLFPMLYGHMLTQRKKMLGGATKEKKTT